MVLKSQYAIVDIFAGAGGLGEGFIQRENFYYAHLSIEKNLEACKTLKIRKLYHLIRSNRIKNLEYIDVLKNQSNFDEFIKDHKGIEKYLENTVWNHELGNMSPKKTANTIISKLKNQGWNPNHDQIILIGGPPCQAYSLAGRGRRSQMIKTGEYNPKHDERNFLYEKYLGLIEELKPIMFLMENVPGILSIKINDEPIFDKILRDLMRPNLKKKQPVNSYELFPLTKQKDLFIQNSDFNINSEKYGVPQARKRVIVFGIRRDLKVNEIPHLIEKKPIAIEKVLNDLPVLRSGISKKNGMAIKDSLDEWKKVVVTWAAKEKEDFTPQQLRYLSRITDKILSFSYKENRGSELLKKRRKNKYEQRSELMNWILDDSLEYHLNSDTRSHMDSDLKRYLYNSIFAKLNKKSPTLRNYPKNLLPKHKSAKKGHQDRFRTLLHNQSSKTITSHIAKDGHAFIHPDPVQCRSLTVREAARIQTFPDNYFFSGTRTQQYEQVGNAVPPILSYQISGIIIEILNTLNHPISQ